MLKLIIAVLFAWPLLAQVVNPGGNGGGGSGNATSLQGRALAATAPSDTNTLCWNAGGSTWQPCAAGSGTVTSVSVATANGVSGSVATATTTPAITLTLGAITPTTVNGNTITTGTGVLTLGAGKTLTSSNTLTLTGNDGSSAAFGAGGTVLYTSSLRTWSYAFQGTTQAAATGFALNLPAATAPTLVNAGGTVPMSFLEWPTAQSTTYAWATFLLPAGYVTNAAISYSMEYKSADSTHATILTPSIACQGTGSTLDNPTFGAAPTANLTAGASSHQTVSTGTWTPNTGSIGACSAGQRVWIKLIFDTNTNSLTGAFDLASATFSVQASM